MLLSGCGLILGAGDYQVGDSTTGSTGSETGVSSSGTASTSSTGAGGSVAGFVVSPGTSAILGGTSTTFTAALDGVPMTSVTWTVVEQNGGTITPTGVYRAPLTDGVFHVQATLSSNVMDDAEITVKTKADSVLLASGDGVLAATGFGFQSHFAYAEGTGEWWLFHDGSDGTLRSIHSKNFTQWGSGPTLSLSQGNSNDGRDLAVASRRFGAVDVVHITQGTGSNGRYHIRGTLSDGAIAFDLPTVVNLGGDGTTPDGAATAMLEDGTVIDVSGWQATPQTPPLGPCGNGDVDVFIADKKEDGTTFTSVKWTETVVWCVQNHVNAHQILPLGDNALILYEDGADDANPVNVLMTIRKPDETWAPVEDPMGPKITPPSVFPADAAMGFNDWTATVAGTRAHAVRHVSGVFEYRTIVPGGGWSDGPAIATEPVKHNDGIFLAPYGDGLVLVALSESAGDPILYTAYDGTSWTAWTELVPSGGSRSFLSGFAPTAPGVKPAIQWTEDGQIRGALLP